MSRISTSASAISTDEPVIAGPFSLYDNSFILEFLEPAKERDASVLMRCVYKHDHPLCKKEAGHPQSPPLHLHLQQAESFCVLSGQVGTTTGYSVTKTIHTPQTTGPSNPHVIRPYTPHCFWPSAQAQEDTTMLVWAHPNPDDMDGKMDRLFFQNILMYVSDISEGKEKMSLGQIMLMQHVTETAMVMLPRLWMLGPLRWWIPLQLQGIISAVARWSGTKLLMEKYCSKEEWESVQERIGGRPKGE